MEPITAQMPDTTFAVLCIITIIFVADVYFSEEWVSARLTKRFRRKLERQRKANGTDKWSTEI
jgi:hypothetical protein